MSTPFGIAAACEHRNVEPGKGTLWASIKVEPRGKALEGERAPLAIALVIDTSGSMKGDPIDHVLRSCEIVSDLLSARDQLAVVAFSTHAGVRCGLTTCDDAGRAQIKRSLAGTVADGNTNMHGGIEVAAGLLLTAPAGLRRAMVVLSDGQPNVGLASATDLASYVRGLKVAVSSLGFGLHHDENVLDAIATAGSGRYAYIPDPAIARVDLARAALAHGGIVADHLELRFKPAEGVELVHMLPPSQLRVGGGGVATAIGDVFVDEGRALAIELAIDLRANASGRIADIIVEGQAPDGTTHKTTATLDVDIRAGARVVDKDAQREVIVVQADAARVAGRAQADRGALPAASSILRQMVCRIDAIDGFVRNDGSILSELREQLQDEAANYERKSTDMERVHQRKAALAYKSATPGYAKALRQMPAISAEVIAIAGPLTGRFELFTENIIGRSSACEIPTMHESLSRHHARIQFMADHYMLIDLGSTNGTHLNGKQITSARLTDGDVIQLGAVQLRFELKQP